jgi:predicted GNAT family N-acyltransferase
VRPTRTQAEVEAAMRLRLRVFCDEQGVALEAEQDGRDDEAVHLIVLEQGRLVGTCRLLMDSGAARLGRMAVEPERRGSGVGGALLSEADRVAAAAGRARIRLHAQTYARGVYDRAGYETLGEPFVEEGIEHVTMEKRVA